MKPKSSKALIKIASALKLGSEQPDVQTAFLYEAIRGKNLVKQLTGQENGSNGVCLNKAPYGLKQAPQGWFLTLIFK